MIAQPGAEEFLSFEAVAVITQVYKFLK